MNDMEGRIIKESVWELLDKIKKLEAENDILKRKVLGREHMIDIHKGVINKLEAENAYLKADNKNVREELDKLAKENVGLKAILEGVRTKAKEITKGEGAFSRDKLEHAGNCIENMISIANDILQALESGGEVQAEKKPESGHSLILSGESRTRSEIPHSRRVSGVGGVTSVKIRRMSSWEV